MQYNSFIKLGFFWMYPINILEKKYIKQKSLLNTLKTNKFQRTLEVFVLKLNHKNNEANLCINQVVGSIM